jgi:hypothetical protein
VVDAARRSGEEQVGRRRTEVDEESVEHNKRSEDELRSKPPTGETRWSISTLLNARL